LTTIRKADLAHELGVRPSAVSNWVSRGMPVQRNGLLNREEALRWVNRNIVPQIGSRRLKGGAIAGALLRKTRKRGDRANGGGGPDTVVLDPAQERARRDRAQAERIERENLLAQGKLVWVDDVAAEYAAACAVVRAKLLSLPNKCAPQVKYCESTEAVRALLEREIVAILSELSRDKEPDEDQHGEP
jgi:phage terminase Nu1 subunit (DNA packaging protein)